MPKQDCTTLKGRTTVVFEIWPMRLPRFARNDKTVNGLAMTLPSVLAEGRDSFTPQKGEGEIPLPLTPSHQGRENYEKFCNLL